MHVQICQFRISESAGRIELKFGRYVVSDPLASLFAKVKNGAQLAVRAHVLTHFRISETAGWIALKFGV